MMAHRDKVDFSTLGNYSFTRTAKLKDYTSTENVVDSMPFKSKNSITGADDYKLSHSKENSSVGFNSGTPCTSTAFTPSGKPSALSKMKNIAKYKSFTSGIFVDDSKPSKDTRPKKELNSGTPCTSKAFTPSGKSSAISASKSTYSVTGKIKNDSASPSIKDATSTTTHQSTMINYTPLEKSPALRAVKPKDFIAKRIVTDSSSSSFKHATTATIHQSPMINYTPSEKSPALRAVKSKEFTSQKPVIDSKPISFKETASVTLNQNTMQFHTTSKKSPAISNERKHDFFRGKTASDFKPSPFKDNPCDTINQNMMTYYAPLRKSSAVSTEKLKVSQDSKTRRSSSSSSETVRQSIFSKYYSHIRKSYPTENSSGDLRDLKFGSGNFQDPCTSQVPFKTLGNSSSIPVDLLRCIICIDKERDTVFQPCGHLVVCSNCAKDVASTCPMCRKRIKKKIKAYIT